MRTVAQQVVIVVAAGALLSACIPSRDALFDPVHAAVLQRTGLAAEWRETWARPPKAQARVEELLAAPLTADSAALVAVLSSPRLQVAFAALSEAGASLGIARALPNPEVEAEVVFPLDDGARRVELSVIQNVSGVLGILPRVKARDAAMRAVRRRATAMTVELIAMAKITFYQAAAAEQRLALRRVVAETARAGAELARGLHQAGNITDFALTREEVFEEEALVALSGAEADHVAAREELNALLGLTGKETGWRLAPLPEVPSAAPVVADLERASVAASLDLDASRWTIEAAGADVGVARFDSFMPEVGVGVAVHQEEDGWSAGPALRFSLPIFNQGQGRRAHAWARLRRAQHEYTAVAIELRAVARRVAQQLTSSHARAVRMQTVVLPLRERLLDEAVRQYNAMNLSPFELLTLRRDHIASEDLYIDALLDYWVALAEVDQLRAGSMSRHSGESAMQEPSDRAERSNDQEE